MCRKQSKSRRPASRFQILPHNPAPRLVREAKPAPPLSSLADSVSPTRNWWPHDLCMWRSPWRALVMSHGWPMLLINLAMPATSRFA
jgi:hypothetical protein